MMRNRSWRKYHSDRVLTKRLRSLKYTWYSYRTYSDVNDVGISHPTWIDRIGSRDMIMIKNGSWWHTKYKSKYSPNKPSYYRDNKKRPFSTGTREGDKRMTMKLIKEYELESI